MFRVFFAPAKSQKTFPFVMPPTVMRAKLLVFEIKQRIFLPLRTCLQHLMQANDKRYNNMFKRF